MADRPRFRLDVPPDVAEVIRHLPPEVKRGVKAALRAVVSNPDLGEPLRRELADLHKYRGNRFRIVYEINRHRRTIRIFGVGHRRDIYDVVSAVVRQREP